MRGSIRKITDWLKKSHAVILSVSLILIIFITVVSIVFLCLGYSFAIREDVRPDWEAIGTIFSFISALGVIGATIFIPWQISQKQNRISLFNLKFEIYQKCDAFLMHWRTHTKFIIDNKNDKKRLFACISSIVELFHKGDNADNLLDRYFNEDNIPVDLSAFISDIHSEARVLFDKASCLFVCLDNKDTEQICDTFSAFFTALTTSLFNKNPQRGIVKASEAFSAEIVVFINKGYLGRMKREIEKVEV